MGKRYVDDACVHHLQEGWKHNREGHNPFIDRGPLGLRGHGFCGDDERSLAGLVCSRYEPLLSAIFMVTSRDAPTLSGWSGGGWLVQFDPDWNPLNDFDPVAGGILRWDEGKAAPVPARIPATFPLYCIRGRYRPISSGLPNTHFSEL